MKDFDDVPFMLISISIAMVNKYGEKQFFVNISLCFGATRDKRMNVDCQQSLTIQKGTASSLNQMHYNLHSVAHQMEKSQTILTVHFLINCLNILTCFFTLEITAGQRTMSGQK